MNIGSSTTIPALTSQTLTTFSSKKKNIDQLQHIPVLKVRHSPLPDSSPDQAVIVPYLIKCVTCLVNLNPLRYVCGGTPVCSACIQQACSGFAAVVHSKIRAATIMTTLGYLVN